MDVTLAFCGDLSQGQIIVSDQTKMALGFWVSLLMNYTSSISQNAIKYDWFCTRHIQESYKPSVLFVFKLIIRF